MEKQLTIDELAKKVGRHPETLRCLARRNALPGAYKLGGEWNVDPKIFIQEMLHDTEQRKVLDRARKMYWKARRSPRFWSNKEVKEMLSYILHRKE